VYRWTTVPFCAGVALLCAVQRPAIGRKPGALLDWALLACLIVVAAQMIPLPGATRDRLSPEAITVDAAVRIGAPPAVRPPHAVSIDVESTIWAFALGASYLGLFWCARATFSNGGVRTTARGVTWMGMALTALVAVQRATSPNLIYWYWRPFTPKAQPYGPFVNRNALATWLAMAIPLVVGYAMARYRSRRRDGAGITIEAVDSTQVWLAGAVVLMTGGLLGSLSRAGMIGGFAGLLTFVLLAQSRIAKKRNVLVMIGGLGVLMIASSYFANLGALAMRMQETTERGEWGRPVIWRDTWQMVSDFWLTGVGAGAYQQGMLVYQSGSRLFFFNQAHDEYLQLIAEGGVLLAVPAAIAVLAAAAQMVHRLRADHTAIFWVRAGAISGIVAAAIHGIWDTSLRTPADGALFAILAAIALHEARPAPVPSSRRSHSH
jgi:O-antigen ligase